MVHVIYFMFGLSALAGAMFFLLLAKGFSKRQKVNSGIKTGLKKLVNKHRKLKPIKGIVIFKKLKTSRYFCKVSNPAVTLQHSGYTNNFFNGFHVILAHNNKTVCLKPVIYNTLLLNNMLIKTKTVFKNNSLIVINVTVTNCSQSSNNIKIMNKYCFHINEPCLSVCNKKNLVTLIYKNSSLLSSFYANNKCLTQHFKLSDRQNSSTNFVNLKLAPKQTVKVSLVNLFHLQPSAMQLSINYENKRLFNSKTKKEKSNFGFMFNYKITTNNTHINFLLNEFLPKKMIKNFNRQNNELNLFSYVFAGSVEHLKKYNYKNVITWLTVRQDYCLLYKFLLEAVLGVKIFGNVISFNNYSNYLGKIIIDYNNTTIVKYNLAHSFYFTYNNIIYKNVNLINLKHAFVDVKTLH